MKKELFLAIVVIFFLSSLVSSADLNQVISNSEDWRDVYSSMLYATLNYASEIFLVSTSHAQSL
jgi:hypothetical protein